MINTAYMIFSLLLDQIPKFWYSRKSTILFTMQFTSGVKILYKQPILSEVMLYFLIIKWLQLIGSTNVVFIFSRKWRWMTFWRRSYSISQHLSAAYSFSPNRMDLDWTSSIPSRWALLCALRYMMVAQNQNEKAWGRQAHHWYHGEMTNIGDKGPHQLQTMDKHNYLRVQVKNKKYLSYNPLKKNVESKIWTLSSYQWCDYWDQTQAFSPVDQ